jgi:hypothetical protein
MILVRRPGGFRPGPRKGEVMRSSVPAVLAVFALVLLPSAPAGAAAVLVELNPSTARPGDELAIRASCDDNLRPAQVAAGPLGTLTVSPRYGFLVATRTLPETTDPGDYAISLTCPGGEKATTTLHVVARVEPRRGPATGGGGMAPGPSGPLLLIGGALAALAGVVLAVDSRRHASRRG